MHPEAEKFFSYIAKQKLTGEQSRVLWYLISKIDFNGYWRVSHQEIADLLKIQRSNVSRSIKVLKEKAIILEGPPAGLNKTYRLNQMIILDDVNLTGTILDFENALDRLSVNAWI